MRVFPCTGWILAAVFLTSTARLLLGVGQTASVDYWLYVAAESDDEVDLIRFNTGGAELIKRISVGVRPTEIEGPHGLRVSQDGSHWYVSLAHGNPFGSVYKYRTGTDALLGSAEVGMFPATLDVAASTGLLYVVNFDLHGEMKPSTISIIETETMDEVAEVEVGVMPHSSRLNASGSLHYSVMMMTDELVETDAFRFDVRRRLSLSDAEKSRSPARPTWVQPSADGRFVYVACNGSNEIKEVDLDSWKVARTFTTAPGPYNIDVTTDGRLLVATYKSDGSTGVWDLAEGLEVARLKNSRTLTHGVVVSPDSKYAFVSVEGSSGELGAVDVIDLETMEIVSSVDTGRQASGIAFWKMA